MKELHIITVGTSILSNFGRIKNIKLPPFSDENFWSQKLEDKTFHEELLKFLEENPKRYSAELNSLLSFLEKRKIEDFGNVYFYLIGTATSSGELCVTVLRNYLKKKGFRDLGEPKEVYGYFKELKEEEKDSCPNCGGWGGGAWNGNDSPFEGYLPCYACGL